MKKGVRSFFLTLLLGVLLPAGVLAMEVAEGVITTGIVERMPRDTVQAYSAGVGELFCFSRITGAVGEEAVTHVWYWQDREMMRLELPVRSTNWRTWSSKKILPEWTGPWRVEILDPQGQVLKTIDFNLT